MSDLELSIERTFDAPRDAVWRAMTDHLAEWWCPRPWTTEVVALDWRAGGAFALTMHEPNGDAHASEGVLLDVRPRERIVFTNLLSAAWQPQVAAPFGIVGVFELSDAAGGGTHYRATSRHASAEDRDRHTEMGFAMGWGMCADQLAEVAKKVAETPSEVFGDA